MHHVNQLQAPTIAALFLVLKSRQHLSLHSFHTQDTQCVRLHRRVGGYTVCETAQTGGYLNTGRFNNRIDTSQPLFLRVVRDSGIEQLFIHYFMVEILTPLQD